MTETPDSSLRGSRFTVLGASGFIGSHLVRHLEADGISCFAPRRDEDLRGRSLGHVMYCIGLTADYRTRSFETVDAHVCKLREVILQSTFDSFLYLSSTRVYQRHQTSPAREEDELRLSPLDRGDIYGISKAMGESIVLSLGQRGRVVRLSNVYGGGFERPDFLSEILREAVGSGIITMRSSLDSARDFVSIADVVALLPRIAVNGRHSVYNVASGTNVTNREVTNAVSRLTGCRVVESVNGERIVFPRIDIERIRSEFAFEPAALLRDLSALVESCRQGVQ